MLTYIVNTSENKKFNVGELFKVADYRKVKWIDCPLDKIENAANDIIQKQNVLGADEYKVAIIIDFFNFDRIRKPYGKSGYYEETGVDINIYFPFIEAYILDHLFDYLRKKNVPPSDADIFFLENGDHEIYDYISDDEKEVKQILFPDASSKKLVETITKTTELMGKPKNPEVLMDMVNFSKGDTYYKTSRTLISNLINPNNPEKLRDFTAYKADGNTIILTDIDFVDKRELYPDVNVLHSKFNVDIEKESQLEFRKTYPAETKNYVYLFSSDQINYRVLIADVIQTEKISCEFKYGCFDLYCTPTLTLHLNVHDYPYGKFDPSEMTYYEFINAFTLRASAQRSTARILQNVHHYYTGYNISPSAAAFDLLSLSLYLIKTYEREDEAKLEDKAEITKLNPDALKDMLITSWNKIRASKIVAENNGAKYYDIHKVANLITVDIAKEKEPAKKDLKTIISDEKAKLGSFKESKIPLSIEGQYNEILSITSNKAGQMPDAQKAELDTLLREYLDQRDFTREINVKQEFEANFKNDEEDNSNKTTQCPSEAEFNETIKEKDEEMSQYLSGVFDNGYLCVDYKSERKAARDLYERYQTCRKVAQRRIIVDLLIMLFTLVVIMVPYIVLNSIGGSFNASTMVLYFIAAGVFAGIFVLSSCIVLIPILRELATIRLEMKSLFQTCEAKLNAAMSSYTNMYKVQLLTLEKTRYYIRELYFLQERNRTINARVTAHRDLLDEVEVRVAALLNNLGVIPTDDINVNVNEDFDISKPLKAAENRVYKVFSLEAIESLFEK